MKTKTKLLIVLGAVVVIAGVLFAAYKFTQKGEKNLSPLPKPEEAGTQLFERGKAIYKGKYYAPFVAVYENMLKELPDNAELKKKLAFAYFGMERFKDAEPLLKDVVKTPLADAEVFYELGFIELQNGAREEAKGHLKKALEIAPDHQDAKRVLQGIR